MHILTKCSSLSLFRQRQPLNSLIGFIDFYLFWFCLISGAFILFTLQLANKLFIIVYTEVKYISYFSGERLPPWINMLVWFFQVFRFPVHSTFSEDSDQTLPVALKCNTSPLLKVHFLWNVTFLNLFSLFIYILIINSHILYISIWIIMLQLIVFALKKLWKFSLSVSCI